MMSLATVRMIALVEQMLALHKQHPETCTPPEQTALQRWIEATDQEIDAQILRALRADGGEDKDS